MKTSPLCILPILSILTTAFSHHPRTIAEIQSTTTTTSISSKITPTPGTSRTCEPTPYATCTRPSNTTLYVFLPKTKKPKKEKLTRNSIPPSAHFGPTYPATLHIDSNGESIILAALSTVTSTWTNGPLYPGLKSAVYGISSFPFPDPFPFSITPKPFQKFGTPPNVGAKKTEAAPPPLQTSLSQSGYNWDAIVRSEWYTTAVPVAWQSVVTEQEKALQSVFDKSVSGHVVSSASGLRRGGGWTRGGGLVGAFVGLGMLGMGVVLL